MIKTISFRSILGLSFAAIFSQAVMADEGLTQAEANTIVKEDLASAQVMTEVCPSVIGQNAKFDSNIKALIQSYLSEYSDKTISFEKMQSDSEYKAVLDEARKAAKETTADEQKSVCNDVLDYEA